MNVSDIVREGAARMADVPIEVDESLGIVAIGDYAFMQGDEAYAFMDGAKRLWDECRYVTWDEVYAYLAEPYCID